MSKLVSIRSWLSPFSLAVIWLSGLLFYTAASWAQQSDARQAWDKTYRPYIIQNVLNRIADEAEQQGFIGWREEVQAHLEQLSTHQLNEVQSAQTYNDVTTIIRGGDINPQQLGAYTYDSEASSEELSSGPQLGDKEQDLVYTPLPPCRIVDTRRKVGKFSAGQTRNYSVNSNTTSQGGSASCGVPDGVNEPAAVVLNLTSSGGSGNGFLTAYPLGTKRPNASVLNYQTQDIANALVLKSAIAGLNEIAVYASAPTHVIIDVMGYLRKPEGVLRAQINAQNVEINKLKALLAGVTRNGNLLRFTGMNVQVVDGTGDTHGTPNGLGNLIVGYNEARSTGSHKTGSHNLIVGQRHNYTSTGGFVAGHQNTISAQSSSVSGGWSNTASDFYSSVSGGFQNTASASRSSVSGGSNNTASGTYSSVSGGSNNTASGDWSSVSGGGNNTASGGNSSVSGGLRNIASGLASSVSSGLQNTASDYRSSVSGGRSNLASGRYSSVSGGRENTASGDYSSVSGGDNNTSAGQFSSISGGNSRTVIGHYDWRAGGLFQDN